MSKTKRYAITGAVVAALINALLNAVRQSNEIEKNPNQLFSWKRFFTAAGKGAVLGGVGGFLLGAYEDHCNAQVKPVNTDQHLITLADNIKLNTASPAYLKLNERVELLQQLLKRNYGNLIHSTQRLGSTESGTALKSKFDIDLGVNFKAHAFRSTEEMFLSVSDLLRQNIGRHSITRIREQRKSLGVFIKIEGKEYKIDIVPCKLTEGSSQAGYLYVNNKGLFERASYTKTNIAALNRIKLTPAQQRIALVLKRWKTENDLPMSSHLLQHLILDAYQYAKRIPRGLTEKVIMVLRHIASDMEFIVIRGVENTNNVITNISSTDKAIIIEAARSVVSEYEYQPNSVIATLCS